MLGTNTSTALIACSMSGLMSTKHLEKTLQIQVYQLRNPNLEINTFYGEMLTSLNPIEQSNCRDMKKVKVHRHLVASKLQ